MQLQETTSSQLLPSAAINELQFGSNINHAVEQNRRADFSLLLAMFSEDACETTPIDKIEVVNSSESILREQLGVPSSRLLASDQSSYPRSAAIANHFHTGGIQSAKLQADLCPDALAYMTENTCGLGEDTYRNLSFHSQRTLKNKTQPHVSNANLYQSLAVANKLAQMHQTT